MHKAVLQNLLATRPTLSLLGLGSERDGLLYVPVGYDESEKAPLAL